MAWANFMILGLGGALLMVPVVLHFLMQPKPKRVDLPTLRFLQERQHSTRSRMRLRHLMLLLLRCLLIALGALALAGPAVASRDFGNWLTVGGIGGIGFVGLGWLAATLAEWTFQSRIGRRFGCRVDWFDRLRWLVSVEFVRKRGIVGAGRRSSSRCGDRFD